MIRRICPICDQVMSLPHYCTTCRSFVKEPWVRDVDYYLNESHPANEADCSYHHMTPGELPVESPWQGAFEALGHSGASAVPNVPRGEQLKKGKRDAGKVLLFIIILYILAQLFAVFSNVVFPLFLDASAGIQTAVVQVCTTAEGSADLYGEHGFTGCQCRPVNGSGRYAGV